MGWAFALLLSATIAGSAAQATEGSARDDKVSAALIGLKGICDRLIVMGRDRTDQCEAKLYQSKQTDKRSGFHFMVDDDTIVSFFGWQTAEATGPNAVMSQAIDTLMFSYRGQTKKAKAAGSCEFSDLLWLDAEVSCRAKAEHGDFIAHFKADGSPPWLGDKF